MAEAICLILDVGASAANRQLPPREGGAQPRSFLDAALECASLFLERKLFLESKDEIGIVLFGTEETQNNLDYQNVKVLERGFCQADWEIISFLKEHVKGTNVDSDWLDALIVSLDLIKNAREKKKYEALKLVLISDLGGESRLEDVDLVIKGMKLLDNVDFTFIGTDQLVGYSEEDETEKQNGDRDGDENGDVNGDGHQEGDEDDPHRPGPSRGEKPKRDESSDEKPLTKTQKLNHQVISEIAVETEGILCSLDDAVATFFYKSKKGKMPWPWKVVFEMGPDIRIGMVGYIKLRREPPKSWKRCLVKSSSSEEDDGAVPGTSTDHVEELRPTYVMVRNNEEQDTVEHDDIITSYMYGSELVTIGEADEAACKFDGGPKSMCLFGFIDRNEISMGDLIGNGSMVFLPVEEDENSAMAVSVLAEALLEMNMVAVVRRVYSARTNPTLAILAPEQDGEGGTYLVYSDLPYSEDRRELTFSSLDNPRHPLSGQQLQAIDDLIDVMDLEPEDQQGEIVTQFNPEGELNPQYQYLYQTLTHRVLNPSQPLPDIPGEIQRRLLPPGSVAEDCAPVIERLISLFPTEKVEQKGKRTADKVFGKDEQQDEDGPDAKRTKVEQNEDRPQILGQEDSSQQQEGEEERVILSVGSINPVQDFEFILAHTATTGATIQSAGAQLEEIVQRFISSAFGTDLNRKIIQCLRTYRAACRQHRTPQLYNDFIRTIKTVAGEKLWSDIVEDNEIGLLRRTEVDGGVEDAEAGEFSQLQQPEDNKDLQPQQEEEEDMEDLL